MITSSPKKLIKNNQPPEITIKNIIKTKSLEEIRAEKNKLEKKVKNMKNSASKRLDLKKYHNYSKALEKSEKRSDKIAQNYSLGVIHKHILNTKDTKTKIAYNDAINKRIKIEANTAIINLTKKTIEKRLNKYIKKWKNAKENDIKRDYYLSLAKKYHSAKINNTPRIKKHLYIKKALKLENQIKKLTQRLSSVQFKIVSNPKIGKELTATINIIKKQILKKKDQYLKIPQNIKNIILANKQAKREAKKSIRITKIRNKRLKAKKKQELAKNTLKAKKLIKKHKPEGIITRMNRIKQKINKYKDQITKIKKIKQTQGIDKTLLIISSKLLAKWQRYEKIYKLAIKQIKPKEIRDIQQKLKIKQLAEKDKSSNLDKIPKTKEELSINKAQKLKDEIKELKRQLNVVEYQSTMNPKKEKILKGTKELLSKLIKKKKSLYLETPKDIREIIIAKNKAKTKKRLQIKEEKEKIIITKRKKERIEAKKRQELAKNTLKAKKLIKKHKPEEIITRMNRIKQKILTYKAQIAKTKRTLNLDQQILLERTKIFLKRWQRYEKIYKLAITQIPKSEVKAIKAMIDRTSKKQKNEKRMQLAKTKAIQEQKITKIAYRLIRRNYNLSKLQRIVSKVDDKINRYKKYIKPTTSKGRISKIQNEINNLNKRKAPYKKALEIRKQENHISYKLVNASLFKKINNTHADFNTISSYIIRSFKKGNNRYKMDLIMTDMIKATDHRRVSMYLGKKTMSPTVTRLKHSYRTIQAIIKKLTGVRLPSNFTTLSVKIISKNGNTNLKKKIRQIMEKINSSSITNTNKKIAIQMLRWLPKIYMETFQSYAQTMSPPSKKKMLEMLLKPIGIMAIKMKEKGLSDSEIVKQFIEFAK